MEDENRNPPVGAGAPMAPVGYGLFTYRPGFGCPPRYSGSLGPKATVEDFINGGSLPLALAKARGSRFRPWSLLIAAELSPDVSEVPNVGIANGGIISQDTVFEGVTYNLLNEETANLSTLSAPSDEAYTRQSGIEVTVDITGQPGGPVVPDFTPLASLWDSLGFGAQNRGWILSQSQGLKMSFNARIAIPFLTYVSVVFHGWIPSSGEYIRMSMRDALAGLKECGYDIDETCWRGSCAR